MPAESTDAAPTLDAPAKAAERSGVGSFVIVTICPFIAAVMLGPAIYQVPLLFAVIALFAILSLFTMGERVLSLFRSRRFVQAVLWLILPLAYMYLIGAAGLTAGRRAQCGAYALVSSSFMREVHAAICMDVQAGKPMRSSIALYALDLPDSGAVLGNPCGCGNFKDVRLGAYTLADLRAQRVDRAAVERSIAAMGDAPTWEKVGRYTFCRDPKAYMAFDASLIVAWEAPTFGEDDHSVTVLYSDAHGEMISFPELTIRLRADTAARAKHSIGPLPPDEPFSAIAARVPQRDTPPAP